MTPKALQRRVSHGWPSKPSASKTTLTMPNWSLNIQRSMMAAMTGATMSGIRSTVCTTFWPGKGRLSKRASARPRPRETPTLAAMKRKVLGSTRVRKNGSVSTLA